METSYRQNRCGKEGKMREYSYRRNASTNYLYEVGYYDEEREWVVVEVFRDWEDVVEFCAENGIG